MTRRVRLIEALEPVLSRRLQPRLARQTLHELSLAELERMYEREIQQPAPIPDFDQQVQPSPDEDDVEQAQERLFHIQAERAADRELFRLEMQRITEPQRRAEADRQEKKDRDVFAGAVNRYRTFGASEANFSLIRQTLGAGFSVFSIGEALLFAWLHWFRRLVVRYEFHAENFLGMVRLGCMKIMLRYL